MGFSSETRGIVSGCNLSISEGFHPEAAPVKRNHFEAVKGCSWVESGILPAASTFPFCSALRTLGTHSRGRSRNQGLWGGGMDVRHRSATADAWSQFTVIRDRNRCHRRRVWNCSKPSSFVDNPGIPCGASVLQSQILINASTSSEVRNASIRSLAHQSVVYPAGTKFLLFSMNSPYPMTISPLSQIERMSGRISCIMLASSTRRN